MKTRIEAAVRAAAERTSTVRLSPAIAPLLLIRQMVVTGAAAVAQRVLARGSRLAPFGRPAIVNGAAGVVVTREGRPFAAVGFTVVDGRISAIDVGADPAKLRAIAVPD